MPKNNQKPSFQERLEDLRSKTNNHTSPNWSPEKSAPVQTNWIQRSCPPGFGSQKAVVIAFPHTATR